MIELVNFSKSYSHRSVSSEENFSDFAVRDVSFTCENNSVTGLVGENGSGKSTIIKAITGNHYATKGNVFVSETDGDSVDVSLHPEKIKLITGYVPEIPVLPSEMKVKDFLNYVRSIFSSEVSFDSVISKCGLETVLNKKIKTLSKGFRQRVSLAQSLISDAKILVLDEPFSGLDPAQIISMRKLISEEAKNKTVLLSTHNLSEVHNLCSRILVMKNGSLVASGSEEEIVKKTNSKTLEEAFLKL